MRLLLDMCLPRRAAELLRDRGHDAVHLGELGLCRLTDAAILDLADREKRVVVTLDADFSALLALSGASGPSVIHLRLMRLSFQAATDVIGRVLVAAEGDLARGCIASVSEQGLRIRELPVSRVWREPSGRPPAQHS